MKNPPAIKSDKLTHLYTLHVRADNTFAVYIDEVRNARHSCLVISFWLS